MESDVTGRRRPTKVKKQGRAQKRKRDDVDIEYLSQAVMALDSEGTFGKFTDLPLSEPTKVGLKECHFSTLTDIQARAIAPGLKGFDILGAAKTGSGKTLAFVVPVLENLYRRQYVGQDAGLGAMIVAPTRELALQIFEVLRKVGRHGHLFAAGLIIGGKSLQEEQHALARMNIVVCTPGRMLQHLSQTAAFSVDNLQMLVLDEADRILDMGFQHDVDAIIEYLPPDRQTLLFSATQTKKVSDLARLSLNDPKYISVHELAPNATPKSLQQNYILTPLSSKLDTLWSFLQSGKKSKILVFLSSGKQVRFVYETFRKLQPGIPLLHLHGRQKQTARLEITTRFRTAKHSCLFATDVVARGLDFPAVDWVVQVDCPEDAETYIHRVGRTARFERDGRAVLFLDPSEEEGMLKRLAAKKIPIERISARANKQKSIVNQLQAICFKDPELKYLGQKAFVSYVRSVHIQKDKDIFQIKNYSLEEFAASLGLPGAPKIKFTKGVDESSKKTKNAPRQALTDSEEDDDEENGGRLGERNLEKKGEKDKTVRTKYDRMFERRNQDILSAHYQRMISRDEDKDEDDDRSDASADHDSIERKGRPTSEIDSLPRGADGNDAGGDPATNDLFTVKRRFPLLTSNPQMPGVSEGENLNPLIVDSQRRMQALKTRKGTAKLLGMAPSRLVFDKEGNAQVPNPFDDERAVGKNEEERREARTKFLQGEMKRFTASDAKDRQLAKDKRQEKKERRRERERAREREVIGGAESDEYHGGPEAPRSKPFEELADLYNDDEEYDSPKPRAKATEPNRPREKKWFERGLSDSDEERGSTDQPPTKISGRGQRTAKNPETLEDLEALAAGVLD